MKLLLGLVPLLVGGWMIQSVRPIVNPKGQPAGLEAHETNASASLLGQFRTSVSAWLWLRTDLYLHNGVEMRPLTKGEHTDPHADMHAHHDEHELCHNESATTVIPAKRDDFRGILGDVERATNTFKDMHEHRHNDPQQALPLYRLMTWLDPQFIRGWTTGATVISWKNAPDSYSKAMAFLDEGLKQNADDPQIHSMRGFLALRKGHDDALAEQAYLAVIRGSEKNFPKDEEAKEAVLNSYRWLSLLYRNHHLPKPQRLVAELGLKRFPDDPVLKRQL